ncbi:T9SS type A sorting domain-containing protein [Hymenobacter gummosus]|uniref:T9SS type A sorting domain-containing protein n=1 Tax=Hymenobacter gummosus TaxID=1776032 RepID=A0A431U941_9BACT|nr:fibronectin type III domain-containing protein [Hymenobacter gummosus]RTQ53356.1 T9SS type A sorting domain-containing protein [Hymenobacter gummosus]
MVNVLRNWRKSKVWYRAAAVAVATLLGTSAANAQVDTYTFAPSAGTFTPLTGGTTVSAIQTDDAISGVIPLGFNFTYDGTVYTQIKASSNGWITFNTAATGNELTNNLDGVGADYRPLVAPLWDDIDGGGGTASYTTTGTAPNRVFTFEWRDWFWNYQATSPVISFQVKLYEGTNRVQFIYQQEPAAISGTPTASIGLSGVGTGTGSFLSLSDASAAPTTSSATETDNISTKPATGQTYTFTPAPLPACPAPRNLTITNISSNGATLNWTILGGGGNYTITYGPTGFTPGGTGSQTTTSAAGTTSVAITGLQPNTAYQAYITQNCGGTAGSSTIAGPVSFTTFPLPATNDECATSVVVPVTTACTTPVTGTVLGATQSLAPTASCGSTTLTTAADVWYRFTATSTSHVVNVIGQFAGVIDVRSGACTATNSVACGTFSTSATGTALRVGGLTANQVYYVRIYPNSNTAPAGGSSSFSICVTPGPTPPTNDECATATPLTVQFGTACVSPINGTNAAATASANIPAPGCASYSGGDVWYSVVVPATGTLTLETGAASSGTSITDTGMAAYSGTCGNLALIECDDDDSANGLYSKLDLTGLTPGSTIYVRVWEFGNDTEGGFSLCAVTPSNCAAPAAPLVTPTSSSATLSWSGTTATGATYEVQYGPQGFTLGTGTNVTGLTTTTTTISGLTSDTQYCYYVRQNCGTVNGQSAWVGPTCFRTLITVPTNDDPCGAVVLTASAAGLTQANGTTLGATTTTAGGANSSLPACSPALAPKDVWYRFTLPAGQTTLNVAMSGNAAGMIRLFTATNCSTAFNLVACRAASGTNLPVGNQSFTGLTAGGTYYIAVSGYNTADTQGAFVIGNVLATRNPLVGGELTVFPNPAHGGTLTLRLNGAGAAQAGQANLINALGQVVRKQGVSIRNGAAEQQIGLEGLSRGLYTLRVEVGGASISRTVVIE